MVTPDRSGNIAIPRVNSGVKPARANLVCSKLYSPCTTIKRAIATGLLAAMPAFNGFAQERSTQVPTAEAVQNPADQKFSKGYLKIEGNQIEEGVALLEPLAEQGHIAANWKLGQIFFDGKVVKADWARASKYFKAIIEAFDKPATDVDIRSYAGDAFAGFGQFYLSGVPDADIARDFEAAKTNFQTGALLGNSEAQFTAAKILYEEEDTRAHKLAAQWFEKARRKNHLGAMALLGYMMFEGKGNISDPTRGLMYITVAREFAMPADQAWISNMHEEIFALATSQQRAMALELAKPERKRLMKNLEIKQKPNAAEQIALPSNRLDQASALGEKSVDWRTRVFGELLNE